MIFDKVEKIDRTEMNKLQLERLNNTLKHAHDNSPFYKNILTELQDLKDIEKLPFTSKKDLIENYPYGFLAVSKEEIARFHASSGTTNKPIITYLTEKDIETWKNAAARVLALNTVNKDDIFQISVGYGMFSGALGFHQGSELIGCSVIPASSGNTERQLLFLKDLGVTAITATPSYALTLAEMIHDRKLDLKLKKILLGAEKCTDKMRKQIEELSGVKTYDNYGMVEFFGPGVSGECEYRCGLHISEDLYYPEIVDPITNKVLGDNEEGELVLTSLTKEAMPLIRYKTGDITYITHEKCKCGRTTARVHAPLRRVDDMVVFKGVNIYPGQIEKAINGIDNVSAHYILTLTRKDNHDYAKLEIELKKDVDSYAKNELEEIVEKIKKNILSIALIKVEIELLSPKTLKRFEGKAKRIEDLRYNEEYNEK